MKRHKKPVRIEPPRLIPKPKPRQKVEPQTPWPPPPPQQSPQVAPPEPDAHICGRCGRVIHFGAWEACWYCTAALCFQCWDIWGHCGHAEADEQNDRARMVQQPVPPPPNHSCACFPQPQPSIMVINDGGSCEPQPRRARPFVRVDGAIILLDEFNAFRAEFTDSFCAVLEGRQEIEWYILRSYTSCEVGKENTKIKALEALDVIQAAIEHWNRAATEPECSCAPLPTKRQITVGEIEYNVPGEFGTLRLDIRQGYQEASVIIPISPAVYDRIKDILGEMSNAP